jgi:hypothetical protein
MGKALTEQAAVRLFPSSGGSQSRYRAEMHPEMIGKTVLTGPASLHGLGNGQYLLYTGTGADAKKIDLIII